MKLTWYLWQFYFHQDFLKPTFILWILYRAPRERGHSPSDGVHSVTHRSTEMTWQERNTHIWRKLRANREIEAGHIQERSLHFCT